MEFDDFFGNKRQDQKGYRDHRYQDSQNSSQNLGHSYQRHDSNYKWLHFLEKLKNNRKLKLIVVFAIILILAIIVTLIVVLMPLIMKLFNYITQNGVQGIMDYITEFLDKLWKGTGK